MKNGKDYIVFEPYQKECNMIKIDTAVRSQYTTTVYPSDNIFEELGKNTYDYKDLISELIDNAIAARYENRIVNVVIDIFVDNDNNPIRFVINDNAQGIPVDRMGTAIAPAAIQSSNSLNEHGLGMKQAVAALGKLEYLATKIEGEVKGRLIRQFKFGDIETFYVQFDQSSGTEISVTDLKPIVITHAATITKSLIPYLGARYRKFLRNDNKKASIVLNIRKSEYPEIIDYSWQVDEVKPVYFHPATRMNQPVVHAHEISRRGWKAKLTIGYAPNSDNEYEELGIEPPNKFHPYRVSLNKQGLDIILHNRVILFHQLSELDIVPSKHPDYNNIRGEIELIEGFSTAITKNSIIYDDHFSECIEEIRAILRGEKPGPGKKVRDYLTQKTYPEEIPERLLRDRLIEWLKNNPLNKKTDVGKEYSVEGIEGFIDIYADNEAWEVKTDQASALDIYQLFMYMDIGNIKKGYLVAKSFSPGASVAAKHISTAHNKEVILATREQFPINQPPTDDEREEYY